MASHKLKIIETGQPATIQHTLCLKKKHVTTFFAIT